MTRKKDDGIFSVLEDILPEENIENSSFSFITEFKGNSEEDISEVNIPDELPILPLRNMVLFPSTVLPISVGRESSLQLISDLEKSGGLMGVMCQKEPEIDTPTIADLHPFGTIAKVVKVFKMPDNSTTVILQGYQKVRLVELTRIIPYHLGKVVSAETPQIPRDNEFKLVVNNCRRIATKIFKSNSSTPEVAFAMKNMESDNTLINFLCANIKVPLSEKIALLEEPSLKERAYHLLSILNHEKMLLDLQKRISAKTQRDLDQQQKEYYLQQQLKNIQEELGGNPQDQDVDELRKKASNKKWSKEVAEVFNKEVAKLERINPQTPDYHVQLNYLQFFTNLPWGEYSKDNLDIKNAQKTLDHDHYGLEKVKERILEHLAVIKMRGDMKAPIICLYGPPGVGKTSLGKSIAEALKRKYVRMSLGGIHDESEIRGHRKTYVGAMPGRILKSLAKVGTDNPVFILDEIDKVGQASMHGDPSSALLEVLDPEQNKNFHDNFLDIDYDLSNVMFIATANNLSSIPAPLLDRMELIEVSGYLTEEKIEIAKRHLIPKKKSANGIGDEKITISKQAIEHIIEDYTRESGVRTLEKKIGKICRKLACQKATTGEISTCNIKPADLQELLGVKEFSRDKYQGNEYAGVVTGLAWTAVGGEILFIETSLSKGKGEKITLTGNLGDVMKESAMLALEYIKSHAEELDIPYEIFEKWNIHLHVPEGAIPKDGPSAGITMTTALASALTQRRVKPNIAMTGEITLRGKVLPVGGIKEKILAAKRAGITEIIICEENRRNIEAIPEVYLKGLTFHFVNDIKEVLEIALLKEKVKKPVNLMV
ncbi:MAG: endopeptidase La [Bacteroidaceae bacterium]|nr:endopeptidase La [Bacteroidaceae bacterium]